MEIIDITSTEFGAIPNQDTPEAREANFFAIHRAQKKVMNHDKINFSIYLPPGIYYLDKSIHIFQRIELFGSGKTAFGGSSYESIIQFKRPDCSFIVHGEYCFNGNGYNNVRSSSLPIVNWLEMFPEDNSVTINPEAAEGLPENYMGNRYIGGFSIIRDLQIWGVFEPDVDWSNADKLSIKCAPESSQRILMHTQSPGTPGIKLISTALLYRVQISSFSGTGLEIDSQGIDIYNNTVHRINNADSWLADNCIITNCGGHGIHTLGIDSQAGMCRGLRTMNIVGNGIYESSFLGNAYYSCYILNSLGHGIRADSLNGYTTVFYSCMVEYSSPNWIRKPAIVIGGNYSDFIDESMIKSSANLKDLITCGHTGLFDRGWRMINNEFTPFQVKNITRDVTTYIGCDQVQNENSAFGWKSENERGDTTGWWLKYLSDNKVWNIGKGSTTALYFTTRGHVRDEDGTGFAGVPYLLLGPYGGGGYYPVRLSSGAREYEKTKPKFYPCFDFIGDIKFNNSPAIGDYAGWIVAEKNGQKNWFPFGKIEDDTVDAETPTDGLRNNNGTLELLIDREIIGAIDVDGNGWILRKKGFKSIPPWNPAFEMFKSEMYKLEKIKIEKEQKRIHLKLQQLIKEISNQL